ncbi:MAG TPA: riboflavin synthase [Patescibacteria group bacterium]|nr:riboflavin synthase [Patescibacteria group bacterium]
MIFWSKAMFSGIIEELGKVKKISRRGKVALLEVGATKVPQDQKIGDSISVNGACLTVVGKTAGSVIFEVMPETFEVTNLGCLRIADKVNLERALKAGDRISGHFVSGHVDCVGIIRRKTYVHENLAFEIAFPPEFAKYLLPKGSIAVDGISLTIMGKKRGNFSVYIIPHTLAQTTLSFKGPSDKLNLEFDILAKRGFPAV